MVDDIRLAIENASNSKQKIAMFHFQILKNAAELEGVDAVAFCQELGVPATYRTEFQKMLSLARLMRQVGYRLEADRIA